MQSDTAVDMNKRFENVFVLMTTKTMNIIRTLNVTLMRPSESLTGSKASKYRLIPGEVNDSLKLDVVLFSIIFVYYKLQLRKIRL